MPSRLVERLGADPRLDGLASSLAARARPLFRPQLVKDALRGRWLGHRLHPVLTDAVVGTWASASLLDCLPGEDTGRSAERLISAGLLASAPTALSGASDWSETHGRPRAVGLVHATANTAALLLYGASLHQRRHGRMARGRWLGWAGLSVLTVGTYLGGHLSYVDGIGVEPTAAEGQHAAIADASS